MSEGEGASATTTEPTAATATEGQPQTLDDVEQVVAESEEKGYFGETPDYDRDAYTLTTGPESPSTLEATLEAKRLEVEAQLDEFGDRAKARAEDAKTRAKGRAGEAKTKAQERRTARQSKES